MITVHSKKVIKFLTRVTASGRDQHQVFEDWLDMVEASLEALPRHAQAASEGKPLEDTPEVQKLWASLRARYHSPSYFNDFAQAFSALLDSTDDWKDTLGDVYMEFAYANSHMGQYFTPWHIAEAMACISMGDVERQVHDRIKAALPKCPEAQAMVLAGALLDGERAEAWLYQHILPLVAPFVEPVTVLDPCVGSGVMLLAAAKMTPRWALDWSLVQFYGQDLDQTCVQMARCNCMLYGLNGYRIRCALSASKLELEALPEPHHTAYLEAQTAQASGNPERVEAIAIEIRSGTYVQASIFEAMQLAQ
jgi:type I restriction-modification system DNA methylase subunit